MGRASASRARCHRLRARNLSSRYRRWVAGLRFYVFVTERGGPMSTIGFHHLIQRPAEAAAVAETCCASQRPAASPPSSLIRPGSSQQDRQGRARARRLPRYGTMTLPEIMALPVAQLAAPTAHLYLWCPNALLPEGSP